MTLLVAQALSTAIDAVELCAQPLDRFVTTDEMLHYCRACLFVDRPAVEAQRGHRVVCPPVRYLVALLKCCEWERAARVHGACLCPLYLTSHAGMRVSHAHASIIRTDSVSVLFFAFCDENTSMHVLSK